MRQKTRQAVSYRQHELTPHLLLIHHHPTLPPKAPVIDIVTYFRFEAYRGDTGVHRLPRPRYRDISPNWKVIQMLLRMRMDDPRVRLSPVHVLTCPSIDTRSLQMKGLRVPISAPHMITMHKKLRGKGLPTDSGSKSKSKSCGGTAPLDHCDAHTHMAQQKSPSFVLNSKT